MNRDEAIERVEAILDTVENETMPVPVRELWVYGDAALGLDPVERLDVYVTKDILLRGDDGDAAEEFRKSHGVEGVGKTVRAEWAEQFPEHIRANDSGHVAPEKCLAAHLLPDDEPVHLEVCNSSFEDNVTQRLQGAIQRESYEQILDPRGVCLWAEGQRSDDALRKLRESELAFPTLPDALEMLGMDEEKTDEAAEAVESYRKRQEGATVRGDVV
ncbi:hypothetical protein M0R89_09770 [Halorussus limi]|uniref:Uncharacterized protein n=1 Tax=Halorussus limi TaxID=2938695 RepID=A0A8U0HPN5_9EURY|nr:hypothetical protein [Halorussus limi]UPV72837.1 hypothetical protein M0R89_09770 [Halorussus limi]